MKEVNNTKPVSFRLSAEIFDKLHEKGQTMQLSAHELASKIVQENYQAPPIPIEAEVVNEAVTCSKQVFPPAPIKQVFHFTMSDMKNICSILCGKRFPMAHIQTMRIGDDFGYVRRIGEDMWEIVVGICNVQPK